MEKFMKKATLIIWVIILGFIALVIFQNQTFFLAKNTLRLNLGISEEYLSPELPNAVIFLIFFFCGVIIEYLFSVSTRFKAKRTIKKLNTNIAAHINELSELKREVNTLKGIETPVDEKADTVKLDMNATQKIANESPDESPADKTLKFDATAETSNPTEDTEEGSSEKKE
jgi:cell division protein FtsL